MQTFQSHVSFKCPACLKVSSGPVPIPEPDWSSAESSSDLNSEGNIYVECTECREDFPGYVHNYAGNVQISLDDYPDLRIDADNAFYSPEDWPEPEVPDDPWSIFDGLRSEVSVLLRDHGSHYGGALINRMLFASLIGGLEAFLSDTLLNALAERKEAQLRLVKHDKEVLAMKFTAAEVLENPDIVIETLTSHLRDISFHKLPRINALYRAALDIDFFALVGNDAVAFLNRAVALRHHVVHRNGRDKEGNHLEDFTPDYVKSVLDVVSNLVEKIDEAVNPDDWVADDSIPF
ncbi:hypothetical protein G6M12_25025 [Agrobacterium tumefaciens]|nr:hypothetical protein [Agrobacterium tumefaciens]